MRLSIQLMIILIFSGFYCRSLVYGVFTSIIVMMLLATYKLIFYPRFLSPLKHIPGPPFGNIVFGQTSAILKGEPGIPQRQWVKDYGPVVRVVGPIGIERLIFTKPSALHQILVSDWAYFPRPDFLRHALGIFAGYGLLAVPIDGHQQMRRAMNPAFSTASLLTHFDTLYTFINSLSVILERDINSCAHPEAGNIFQMYEWASKLTLDMICEVGFGYTTDSLHHPHNELTNAYEKVKKLQTYPNTALLIFGLWLPGGSRCLVSDWAYNHRHLPTKVPGAKGVIETMLENMYSIRKVATQILGEKMREHSTLQPDPVAKRDVMSLLVRARRQETVQASGGYTMTDYDMIQHVLTVLSAGHETTASGLAWTFWLLANDIPSQTRLRDEVSPLFFEPDARPPYKRLNELLWLDCVIMEALRVLPPGPISCRTASRDCVVDGIFVPKGTLIEVNIRVVNTWKEIWGDDAEEFKPQRWLNLPPKSRSSTAFLSFLAGPNGCIGKTMALMQMKAVVASLIAKFEFTPAFEGQQIHPTAAITMTPSDGLPLRVRKVGMSSHSHCN